MRKTLLLTLFAIGAYDLSQYLPPLNQPPKLSTAAVVSWGASSAETGKRFLTRNNFEDVSRTLYNRIRLASYKLDYNVFRMGLIGYYSLQHQGELNNKHLLTIILFAVRKRQQTTVNPQIRKMKPLNRSLLLVMPMEEVIETEWSTESRTSPCLGIARPTAESTDC